MAEPVSPGYISATIPEILDLVRENGRDSTQKPEFGLDPTKNVIDKVTDAVKRLDDLRDLDRSWRDKYDAAEQGWRVRFDAERQRADAEAKLLERGRLDALRAGDTTAIANALSTAATAAQTLQAQVVTSANALSIAAAATKDTQDKAIVALQLIASSSGGILSGRESQERRGQDNSSRYVAMGVAFLIGLGTIATIIYTVHAVTGR